jgi:molybdopterin-binding protein
MIVAHSARNRFPGVVSKVVRDGVSAVVEVVAGPHRLVSLMTAEAAEELGLAEGVEVIGIVKATDMMIQIPQDAPAR